MFRGDKGMVDPMFSKLRAALYRAGCPVIVNPLAFEGKNPLCKGFYSRQANTIFLREGLKSKKSLVVLAHEAVHFIQRVTGKWIGSNPKLFSDKEKAGTILAGIVNKGYYPQKQYAIEVPAYYYQDMPDLVLNELLMLPPKVAPRVVKRGNYLFEVEKTPLTDLGLQPKSVRT